MSVAALALLAAPTCEGKKPPGGTTGVGKVVEVNGVAQIQALLDTSGQRLLVFDMYADWCMPCRFLSPILEKIAAEHGDRAGFYKVNIDRNPEITSAFGVSGIPFVVFVRDRVGLEALTGVHPPETYVRIIDRLQVDGKGGESETPNGEIVEGVRVIRLTTDMAPGNLYVYRGETVQLMMDSVPFAYSLSIPEYGVAQEAQKGGSLSVTFKAKDVGVFAIFCNGDCPAGDGSRYGQVMVMQYKSSGDSKYSELTAAEAKVFLAREKPLVLDVRTPKEFYAGHIEGARLIPVQQLERRVKEIAKYRSSKVLLYCRSGNRSTVAAQILARHGFTDLYNLRPGMRGWQAAGLPVTARK